MNKVKEKKKVQKDHEGGLFEFFCMRAKYETS